MALGLIFGGCIILIYQKMKLQSKNYEILNKQKLRKKIYIYLPLTCFLFRNSLTTIYSRTIISSSSGMSCKSSVSKIAAEFSPFVFLPLSTRAYFKGRAYIKIILKNHARSYFAGRSYYRGSTVVRIAMTESYERLVDSRAGDRRLCQRNSQLCRNKNSRESCVSRIEGTRGYSEPDKEAQVF